MRTVAFYFDPISPYAWLAATRLEAFEKEHGIEFIWTPVLFAGLLNAHGNMGPAEIPAKREHTLKDALRWASYYGLPYQGPPEHPFKPLLALRFLTAIAESKNRARLGLALLRGIWEEGLNAHEEETFIGLAAKYQLDGKQLIEAAQSPVIKEKLRQNTDAAIAQGVFGVPTFMVDGELFWGHDRLSLLGLYLQGKLFLEKEKVTAMLQRPRGADRSQIKS